MGHLDNKLTISKNEDASGSAHPILAALAEKDDGHD
jgi:hypothetical protein